MKKKTEHSLTPWVWRQTYTKGEPAEIVISSGATHVASMAQGEIEDEEADAAFIVRAVNAHEELLNMAQAFKNYLEGGALPSEAVYQRLNAVIDKSEVKP